MLAARLQQYNRVLEAEGSSPIFSRDQRGFLRGIEGCSLNSFILREYFKHQRRDGQQTKIAAWIDFRNAFGSIDHKVIEKCLSWLNVPAYIRKATRDIYLGANFQVKSASEWTTPITMERGIKQGCGFSPLIFNMCLEFLLRWLNVDALSSIGGKKFAFLAYADDLVLLSPSVEHARLQFAKVRAFGDWANLHVKPSKCAAVAISYEADGSTKSFDPKIPVRGGFLPSLSKDGNYRFLGTLIDATLSYKGARSSIEKALKSYLTKLHLAPVPAFMKLEMLRRFVFPKLTFPLATASAPRAWLQRLDRTVRRAVRSWLSLPPCSTTSHFYASPAVGGLNLVSFEDAWARNQASTAIKALCHPDDKLAAVAKDSLRKATDQLHALLPDSDASRSVKLQEEEFGVAEPAIWMSLLRSTLHNAKKRANTGPWAATMETMETCGWRFLTDGFGRMKLSQVSPASPVPEVIRIRNVTAEINIKQKTQHLERWKSLPLQGAHVRALEGKPDQGRAVPQSFAWLRKPWRLSDSQFSWAMKCFLNLIPCRWNLHQWKKKPDKRCQFCKSRWETPLHALNGCKSIARYKIYKRRHDVSQNLIADVCLQNGFEITVDKTYRGDIVTSSLRPDIIKYEEAKKVSVMVDCKCPFSGGSHFHKVNKMNCDKYSFYGRRAEPKGWKNSVHTFICSSSGIIPACSKKALKSLGIPSCDISKILEDVNIKTFRAGYRLRRTLGQDRRGKPHIYRRRSPAMV